MGFFFTLVFLFLFGPGVVWIFFFLKPRVGFGVGENCQKRGFFFHPNFFFFYGLGGNFKPPHKPKKRGEKNLGIGGGMGAVLGNIFSPIGGGGAHLALFFAQAPPVLFLVLFLGIGAKGLRGGVFMGG